MWLNNQGVLTLTTGILFDQGSVLPKMGRIELCFSKWGPWNISISILGNCLEMHFLGCNSDLIESLGVLAQHWFYKLSCWFCCVLKVETTELEFSMERCEDSNTDGWGTLFDIFSGSQNYHQSNSNSESSQLNLSGQGSSHPTPVPSLPGAFHHTEHVFCAASMSAPLSLLCLCPQRSSPWLLPRTPLWQCWAGKSSYPVVYLQPWAPKTWSWGGSAPSFQKLCSSIKTDSSRKRSRWLLTQGGPRWWGTSSTREKLLCVSRMSMFQTMGCTPASSEREASMKRPVWSWRWQVGDLIFLILEYWSWEELQG